MKRWLYGRGVALVVFLAVGLLVTGGLGWVTAEALRLETEQFQDRAHAEFDLRLKRAMWQLDSRIWPVLAKEEGRPYNHYTALYAPLTAFHALPVKGKADAAALQPVEPGTVLEPSPLLTADLPPWMVLHFQTNMKDWQSPQILSRDLNEALKKAGSNEADDAAETAARCEALDKLRKVPTAWLCQQVEERAAPVTFADTVLVPNPNAAQTTYFGKSPDPSAQAANTAPQQMPQAQSVNNTNDQGQAFSSKLLNPSRGNDYNSRVDQQARVQKEVQNKAEVEDMAKVIRNVVGNGYQWLSEKPYRGAPTQKATVKLGPMVPLWPADDGEPRYLIVARMVNIGDERLCQGVLLDWARLQAELGEAVHDEFPDAKFLPVRQLREDRSNVTMAALPVELSPGPFEMPELPTWTPMRAGLVVAWGATLLGLAAAGLGGWSLLALSERRIRFVSAVTHELRTPLTTLRLYLDMLAGGLVAPAQQEEYVRTLHGETDRLNRLVSNVLDFSRLENQRPRLSHATVGTADLLEQVRGDWACRCQNADKALVVENDTPAGATVTTDVQLVQQVLGNLVDNACKYSQGAEDRRIVLRARRNDRGRLVFAVEDHGPGVAAAERRSIFRAFRRGQTAGATTGGVGLGLALARRWARLLGGRLQLENRANGVGACFQLELPKQAG